MRRERVEKCSLWHIKQYISINLEVWYLQKCSLVRFDIFRWAEYVCWTFTKPDQPRAPSLNFIAIFFPLGNYMYEFIKVKEKIHLLILQSPIMWCFLCLYILWSWFLLKFRPAKKQLGCLSGAVIGISRRKKEDEEIRDTACNNESTSSACNRFIYSLQYTRNYPRTPWGSFNHSIMHEHSY